LISFTFCFLCAAYHHTILIVIYRIVLVVNIHAFVYCTQIPRILLVDNIHSFVYCTQIPWDNGLFVYVW